MKKGTVTGGSWVGDTFHLWTSPNGPLHRLRSGNALGLRLVRKR